MNEKLLIAKGKNPLFLNSKMLNRHGIITGATGTGKTVTLKVIAEQLSDIGVSVVLSDVKGDLTSMACPGENSPKIEERYSEMNETPRTFKSFPVEVWDVYGEYGHPIRTSISEMGPVLLSRILGLTEAQEGVLNIAFRIADEQGLLLIDLKDLRSVLSYLSDNSKELSRDYGNIASQSLGAIQRRLLVLEEQGGNLFFGEPGLDINDFFRKTPTGEGYINIINSKKLINSPALYSTFLFWMLTEIDQLLPEVGDLDKPKLVFFFDEAHLLFDNSPKALLDIIDQMTRLIRSKGVSIFYVTQNPIDIPDKTLSQLGNKIQHALRAYSPREQKAIKAVAENFRQNPDIDIEAEISNLRTGEAFISFIQEDGSPEIVQKGLVLPPRSSLQAVNDDFIKNITDSSPLLYKYKDPIDRESAFEVLSKRILAEKEAKELEEKMKIEEKERLVMEKEAARLQKEKEREEAKLERERERSKTNINKIGSAFLGSLSRSIGSAIGRTIFGTIKKGIFK